jgi:sugar lactone lactonase YvrE
VGALGGRNGTGVKRAALLCLVGLVAAVPSASAAPREYVLPGANVFPEGIALRPGTSQFFVSSSTNGAIFRGTTALRLTRVFLPPGRDGRRTAVGLRATRLRLIVAGGGSGLIFVYRIRARRLGRRFSTGSGGVMNDVAITPDGEAYVTDSRRGLLFRVRARALRRRAKKTRALRPFLRLADTPVGSRANGIVSAGSRYLLVVGTDTGALVRVDLRSKRVRAVDLGGATLPRPDGLARRGRTLYAVNSGRRITQLAMSRDWLRARVVRHITSPRFRLPTTVAVTRRRLLVVNSQFDKRGARPVLPFSVSAVARP